MSGEIKVQRAPVEKGIAELRASIQALETSFAKEIQGQNKLDVVNTFNEIKSEYDQLLSQFETLFINNVQSTEDAVASLQETEQRVAADIRIMK